MQRKNKKEIYSIRKFKVGVGSALIGLSFLGATGVLDHIPVVKDVVALQSGSIIFVVGKSPIDIMEPIFV